MAIKSRRSTVITPASGVVNIGREFNAYSLQASGGDATLNVRRLAAGAAIIWTDITINGDGAVPFRIEMEEPAGEIFVEVTGGSATCYCLHN